MRILPPALEGPLEVDGTLWQLEMPAYVASFEDLAAVATYVRREWGHGADPVDADTVDAVDASCADRRRAWTVEELGGR